MVPEPPAEGRQVLRIGWAGMKLAGEIQVEGDERASFLLASGNQSVVGCPGQSFVLNRVDVMRAAKHQGKLW